MTVLLTGSDEAMAELEPLHADEQRGLWNRALGLFRVI